jgi:hypothetical protein
MATNTGEFDQIDLATDTRARLQCRLAEWSARLRATGLDDLAGAFLGAAEPFGPLGAQLLWVAQPALGLLLPREEIGDLACLLDDPAGMAWLRSELTGGDE